MTFDTTTTKTKFQSSYTFHMTFWVFKNSGPDKIWESITSQDGVFGVSESYFIKSC